MANLLDSLLSFRSNGLFFLVTVCWSFESARRRHSFLKTFFQSRFYLTFPTFSRTFVEASNKKKKAEVEKRLKFVTCLACY